jgi:predicted membrane protein
MTAPVPAVDTRPLTARSVNTRVLGGLLLVFGSGWLLQQTGVPLPWTAIFSLVLVALGLALVVTSRRRANAVPLIILGAVLTVGLAIGSSDIHFRGGFGEKTFAPHSIAQTTRFDHVAGDVTLDLRNTEWTSENPDVRAEITFGRMLVKVPSNVGVLVDVHVSFGEATIFGQRHEFKRSRDRLTAVKSPNYDGAEKKLHLVLKAFAGEIDVQVINDNGK